MATFVSPDGNFEVWDTRPDGYTTPDDWMAAHPPTVTPHVPTQEEQIASLTAEYTREKANLCEAFTTATMQGDTETAQSVAADMADLDAWFDEEYRKIEEGSEA
jgi:hypothetical protein